MKNLKVLSYFSILFTLLHLYGCSNVGNMDSQPTEPEGREQIVIYEANPKVFARKNAINAISERLDNIAALGTDILWLMPIYEQGELKGIGSPYCVRDYKRINPEFGTIDDLKALVAKAHSKGMKVILDWVANHTSWDSGWIEHKDWYTQDASGNIISPSGWADVADLNYDSSDMRKAMTEAMEYWLTETDVDGFRCDYAEGVPNDFWKTAIRHLRTIKGDGLIMLAEGSRTSLYDNGFDIVYSWDFASDIADVFNGNISTAQLYRRHIEDLAGVQDNAYRMRYITNHDIAAEASPVSVFKSKEGALAAFVVTSMLSDCIMIYSSQEAAYPSALSFFSYNVIDWNSAKDYTGQYER
ncbi:MAG: alpha-amylase, partial [Bacteroidales bacterium]|nr:alpha-amylase [Bacteroidales bacterium]